MSDFMQKYLTTQMKSAILERCKLPKITQEELINMIMYTLESKF